MSKNVGDIIEGEIIDFTHEGNGVLKIDNFAVFVAGGIIGDKVAVKIDEVKKNFAIGSVIKLIKPSKDRVGNNFSSGSGEIPLIEYKYEKQLEWKKTKVKMDLVKFAELSNVTINDTIGMDDPYRYRNHTQIPVGSRNGKVILGFYVKGSHNIVDMEGSILQPEIADLILSIIREWINKYEIKPYDRRANKGVLRHVGIRTNDNNQAMVIIVTSTDSLPNKNELIKMLNSKIKGITSIYQNINNLPSAPTYGRKYKKLYGEDRLIDHLGEFKFHISPDSFFQVNRKQAEVLYSKAMEYLELNKDDIVFDIYSGIGTISLFIANKARKVYGIESIKSAIDDAKENSKLNNVNNTEFILGKAEEVIPDLMDKGTKCNKIVLDPPRKGCEKEVIEAIVKMSPEKIVYVSCNPTTMARDLKGLLENGYKVMEVQPVDMFPHTTHVESIIMMTYCGSEGKR